MATTEQPTVEGDGRIVELERQVEVLTRERAVRRQDIAPMSFGEWQQTLAEQQDRARERAVAAAAAAAEEQRLQAIRDAPKRRARERELGRLEDEHRKVLAEADQRYARADEIWGERIRLAGAPL